MAGAVLEQLLHKIKANRRREIGIIITWRACDYFDSCACMMVERVMCTLCQYFAESFNDESWMMTSHVHCILKWPLHYVWTERSLAVHLIVDRGYTCLKQTHMRSSGSMTKCRSWSTHGWKTPDWLWCHFT